MGIEMEAADMLVDLGKGLKALDGTLGCFQDLALKALRLPRNVLYGGCLLPA